MNKETAEKNPYLEKLTWAIASAITGSDSNAEVNARIYRELAAAPSTPSEDVIRQMYQALKDADQDRCICTGKREENPDPEHCHGCRVAWLLAHPELKRYGGGK